VILKFVERHGMTISSMTGFARSSGSGDGFNWLWELKSVNGKSLDMRLRLPNGLDHLEADLRQRLAKILKRGNIQASLQITEDNAAETVVVNQALLKQLSQIAETLRKELGSAPIQAENLLSLRGVIEPMQTTKSEAQNTARDQLVLAGFEQAAKALHQSRREEGARLQQLLQQQLQRISELAQAARNHLSRQPEIIRQRLSDQIDKLLGTTSSLDPERLHQEAILLATRNDIQEELDRLDAHLEAAADLLRSAEPIGRKFDFLTQEFNREANTLCSKANDKSLTAMGLDLKTIIDQMREQVQNIE
jgi:uncharacterized protein (TIGR00255 family)